MILDRRARRLRDMPKSLNRSSGARNPQIKFDSQNINSRRTEGARGPDKKQNEQRNNCVFNRCRMNMPLQSNSDFAYIGYTEGSRQGKTPEFGFRFHADPAAAAAAHIQSRFPRVAVAFESAP